MVKKIYSMALLMCLAVLTAAAQTVATVSADPADGSTVEQLSSVTLTFNGASNVDKGAKAGSVTITSDKGYNAGCTLDYGTNDNQMTVTFTAVTEEATYTLDFPENAFTAEGATIPAFTLTYRIGEEKAEGLVLTPAAGTVTWLTDIAVSAAEAPGKGLNTSWNAAEKPALLGPDGKEVVIDLTSIYDSNAGFSTQHIVPRMLITTPGEYTLVIPNDYYYYTDDSWNSVYVPGTTVKYNVLTGQQETFTSVPAKDQPVSQFQTLTITFPNATSVTSNSSATITLYQNGETWKGSGSLNYNFTFEGNTMSYSVYSPIIDAGHYTMNFPEGCVLLDGTPCAPFMVEFDIVESEPLNMVVTPAEGASVEGLLNSALITFPDNEDVQYNPSSITLYIANGENDRSIATAYGTSTTIRQDDGKSFVVNFPGIATESGIYKIVIPKNAFAVGDRYNAETTVTFSYTAPEAAGFTVTPAPESTLDRVQNFTINFDTTDDVTVNTALTTASILLYKGIPHKNEYGYLTGGSQLSSVSLSSVQKTEGQNGEFTFAFSTPGIEQDDYALIIPAGIFLVGDKTFNKTDTLIYHATGNGLDKIEATPSQPVQSLKNITLTFTNETAVTFQSNYASTTLYRVNPDATYDTYLESISATKSDWSGYAYIDESEPNTVKIELKDEYTEAGDYYIDLGGYFLYMSDGTTANTVNKIHFTVDPLATGISDVRQSSASAEGRIYTISGAEVKEAVRPGLYIRNGKKFVVK